MTQRIFITVIPGAPGEYLLANAQKMLAEGSVVTYVHSLIDSHGVRFYSDHLDLWSMGDSFDRSPECNTSMVDHRSFMPFGATFSALLSHRETRKSVCFAP